MSFDFSFEPSLEILQLLLS